MHERKQPGQAHACVGLLAAELKLRAPRLVVESNLFDLQPDWGPGRTHRSNRSRGHIGSTEPRTLTVEGMALLVLVAMLQRGQEHGVESACCLVGNVGLSLYCCASTA